MAKEKIKILFIEDEDLLRSLFSEALSLDTDYDYEIVDAMDLNSGFKKLEESKPDIVMLDLILPYDKNVATTKEDLSEKMGISFLEKVKGEETTKSIPVIVFSNLDDPEIKKRVLNLGAYDYLIKSMTDPIHFNETIKKALNKK
ncbi:MAG: hypothetical protein A3H06_00130 [Candidatus Colwellbacteria bacterium RIFCSPLOWO2_12_FULL_44_13]|uniref:Response regulatory domain-containing protein n=3 Tax=Candidatus Colwelliibacteriota TaxID=1817904 RepID=A0A1G1Z8H6_9BACT|nr:MAG: hypothetical protein A3F24_02765 [Candidatus Colwellbacteria bacterium RIFCSPHIGHO2_12_FULL_44_17]OGY60729.1 MAG: hypothetical protein A3I31_02680 [Candidatus Colwellbacteria bacterium RIFCSPLOWO2_02_FULL_44_20b]OGY62023.1 MAG: hypothetical protein A3H06_00130 [Candidatus Colwellbacteria bacterium RIFCSPLOWO2_12_FULL_44_13]